MDVEVRVPATVANLGPGFDCLGVALGLHLGVRFKGSDHDQITGKGRIRTLPDNLTYRAFIAAFDAAGVDPPTVNIEIVDLYPSARGLGASASAIVAGLAGARAAGDLDLDDAELARIAISIEGHGDNVLPALFGGLVLNSSEGWMRFEPSAQISPIVFVARDGFKTAAARRVLPADVPRSDAVANAAATAALVAVLTGAGPFESLLLATEDRLHEPYRPPLMPASMDLHAGLRSKGIATALSGAGPSLISLVNSGELEGTLAAAEQLLPDGWQVLTPGWDLVGAQIR